ncbi:sensor domain-containing diguanylate cyclase [Pseudomonas sp. A3.4]|nr:sensor domain-containing diguanylate cyclase [Atopomonas sediminilitoris]
MQSPAPHPEEVARQASLNELDVLDTPSDPYFDSIVTLAKNIFGVQTALISLVDQNRQWFKARVGLDCIETDRDVSFCGHAILQNQCLIIEDTLNDQRFFDNPLVTQAPFIRFYAGVPLVFLDQPIGTLCLIDPTPQKLSEKQLLNLKHLANLAEGLLRLHHKNVQTKRLRTALNREHRQTLLDPLTQLWNRRGLDEQWDALQVTSKACNQHLGAILMDLDHFKRVNDELGHLAGDRVLWAVARRLTANIRPDDLLIRFGGEEFLLITRVKDQHELELIAERLRSSIASTPVHLIPHSRHITLSLGAALMLPDEPQESLLTRADSALYEAKANGRNRAYSAPSTHEA